MAYLYRARVKSRVYLLPDFTVLFVALERRIPLIRLIFRASITAKAGGELKPDFSPAHGILDTNVFIAAKNLHYGLDFCPAFWDWLIAGHAAGSVFSILETKG